MKLNVDSVRKILLCLEQNLVVSEDGEFEEVSFVNVAHWCGLSVGETLNTLFCLNDAGLIVASSDSGEDCISEFDVYRITFQGYQFLESIRPETVFSKVKKAGSKAGSLTFENMIEAAKALTVPIILDALKTIP